MSLVRELQEMKRIYGVCPCCGELFRLSDANIYTRGAPPKTDFDRLDEQRMRLLRAEQEFYAQEAALRAEAVREGQLAAQRRLNEIAPFFVSRGINPHDVKVLFDPVMYVVFNGLSSERPISIELVDSVATNPEKASAQASIQNAICCGNIGWLTLRVDDGGRVTARR